MTGRRLSIAAAGTKVSAAKTGRALLALLAVAIALPVAGQPATNDLTIAGIWQPDASRSERFPADPPYTPAGREIVTAWRASHDPIEDDPGRFCQSPGMPSLALGGADYPVEIIVTPRQVTFLMELHQQVRRIYLDRSAHPERPFPQRNGHSIGRWEGDTLVVDTTAIKAITFGSVPHSNQVHVTERIRPDRRRGCAGQRADDYRPGDVFGAGIVVRQYYRAAPPDIRMLEYECTEGMWIEHEESRGIRAAD